MDVINITSHFKLGIINQHNYVYKYLKVETIICEYVNRDGLF